MQNLIPIFIVLLVFMSQRASAVPIFSGCAGGDFGSGCSLAELNAGGSIQIGDILFDNWDVDLVAGSLKLIAVNAIGGGSQSPGPGLLFGGPGVVSNGSIGFEMNYDVSTIGGTPILTGYELTMGFIQRVGTAGGFTAMEITDNVLVDTFGAALEIANPEPTVTDVIPMLSDLFTDCNNDGNCPSIANPALSNVISSDFRVTTNLDVFGGANGSFAAFDLAQRFSLTNSAAKPGTAASVDEPTSVALLSLGLLGLCLKRKKRV